MKKIVILLFICLLPSVVFSKVDAYVGISVPVILLGSESNDPDYDLGLTKDPIQKVIKFAFSNGTDLEWTFGFNSCEEFQYKEYSVSYFATTYGIKYIYYNNKTISIKIGIELQAGNYTYNDPNGIRVKERDVYPKIGFDFEFPMVGSCQFVISPFYKHQADMNINGFDFGFRF